MPDSATGEHVVITRHFGVPRHRVYHALTDPDELARWFGPVGFSVPRETVQIDPRVGGRQRLVMVSDEDPSFTSPVEATYTDVVPDRLLVGRQDVAEDPHLDGSDFILRLELEDAPGGGTRLVLEQGPYRADVVDRAREGWLSSFTKLDAVLDD